METLRRVTGGIALALGLWGGWHFLVLNEGIARNADNLLLFWLISFGIWAAFSAVTFWGMLWNLAKDRVITAVSFLGLIAAVVLAAIWALVHQTPITPVPAPMAWWFGSWIAGLLLEQVLDWAPN